MHIKPACQSGVRLMDAKVNGVKRGLTLLMNSGW